MNSYISTSFLNRFFHQHYNHDLNENKSVISTSFLHGIFYHDLNEGNYNHDLKESKLKQSLLGG